MSQIDVGMNPLKSPKIYPRPDNVYKHKKSLNYDAMRSKIMKERKVERCQNIIEWFAYACIAVVLAATACFIEWLEEHITHYKKHKV